MTEDQLFDPPDLKLEPVNNACLAVGTVFDWTEGHRQYRPKCNRPTGHEGPHRRYARDALVLAEWFTR